MYEYKFVECPIKWDHGRPSPDSYRSAIQEHGRQGWRLVQVFIPVPAAVPGAYELIFERPGGEGR